MLQTYATRLNSVEIDSTFYRMPTLKALEAWKAATPEEFRFTIKASQQITHRQRLKVPSKMLYFPDEGHWVLKPQNSRLWYQTVNGWVDQYLKK